MKILLDVKGVGLLAIIPHNYVVADGIRTDKRGLDFFVNERYFPSLSSALDELRKDFQKRGLSKGKPATSISELLERIEKNSKKWFSIIKKAEFKGLPSHIE